MPVPTVITDLSTTAASNSPSGSDAILPDLDNYIRALSAFIAQNYASLATKQASLGYTPVNKAGDTLTGVLAATKGTAALPGIAFSGDTNTGIHSSGADILDLVTAGVAQWRVDDSGRLVAPARTQPCFRAKVSATLAGAGTFTTYSTETDDGSNFDAATGVFTAPIAGWYNFSANFNTTITTASVAYVGLYIYAGGEIGRQTAIHSPTATTIDSSVTSGPIYLSAGTTVSALASSVVGSSSAATLGCSNFSGRLLG